MTKNDAEMKLERYVLPKFEQCFKKVNELLLKYQLLIPDAHNEGLREEAVNREIQGSCLEALLVLHGNEEAFESCLKLAHSRNWKHGLLRLPYDKLGTSSFCTEVKALAYLLAEEGNL